MGLKNLEMHEDTKALGFVMLQLIERGSIRRERLVLQYPDKWLARADKFFSIVASSTAKALLSVRASNA
jgi:hypothetical protein